MTELVQQRDLTLAPANNQRLATLCGPLNQNLALIETLFHIAIHQNSHQLRLIGDPNHTQEAAGFIKKLYQSTRQRKHLSRAHIQGLLTHTMETSAESVSIRLKKTTLQARNPNQARYIDAIKTHDINFGIGPAGTGKTFLAVACAVEALENEKIERLVFVRPAVEAGEKLGFLPGDLEEKISPYLRPLYDALYDLLGTAQVNKLTERNVIEIAPLAFMRGRTLNDAFIILDEGQNTTTAQMKMFLTRIGFGSTAVVTGDVTQIDLPNHQPSGLVHALSLVQSIDAISVTHFTGADSVRHPLVKTLIEAYQNENKHSDPKSD